MKRCLSCFDPTFAIQIDFATKMIRYNIFTEIHFSFAE